MHELSILYHVVKTVEDVARENGVEHIETLVLQIGELSSVVPQYIRACYPAAVDGSLLENTKLEIEMLPANALCKSCGKVYNVLKESRVCPYCGGADWELLSGREFSIKEIVAY